MTLGRSQRRAMSTRGLVLTIVTGVAFLNPMLAQAQMTLPTVEQLQKEIQGRNAAIRDLVTRVAKLERQMATGMPPGAAKKATASRTAMSGELAGPPLLRPSSVSATSPPPSIKPTQESQAPAAPK